MHLARDRIVAEARALCQVEHPNVVRFYSLPIDEASGVMGLAMEHVACTPLDQRLRAAGRLSVADTLAMGIAIASALSAVHRAGLVHRDVKPSNIIEAAGVYKLIDFGVAAADALLSPEASPSSPAVVEVDGLSLELPPPPPALGALGATVSLGRRSGTIGYIDPVCVATLAPAVPASDRRFEERDRDVYFDRASEVASALFGRTRTSSSRTSDPSPRWSPRCDLGGRFSLPRAS